MQFILPYAAFFLTTMDPRSKSAVMDDKPPTASARISPEEARGKTTLYGREELKPMPKKQQGRPSQVYFGEPIPEGYDESYCHWRGAEREIYPKNPGA